MDVAEVKAKISEYRAMERDVIARQDAATTDALRFECERKRRLIETVISGLLDTLLRNVTDEHIGRTDDQADGRQAAA